MLDLLHLGSPSVLAAYLVRRGGALALVDCGPSSCFERLTEELSARGVAITDIDHLMITHVHLDHSGAAGRLVAQNPALDVCVSEIGAPHLIDPSRLERSARRLFGDQFDLLAGAMVPVPSANITIARGTVAGFECFPTPGHAKHHVSFLADNGTCFPGDVTGMRIAPATYIAPGTPPPDIDLDAYARSLAAIEARAPSRLCLPHFGVVEDPERHIELMRGALARWSGWVRDGVSEEQFTRLGQADLACFDSDVVDAIEANTPFSSSYRGLERHWRERSGATSSWRAGGSSADQAPR